LRYRRRILLTHDFYVPVPSFANNTGTQQKGFGMNRTNAGQRIFRSDHLYTQYENAEREARTLK
jgi:hypothetical protein